MQAAQLCLFFKVPENLGCHCICRCRARCEDEKVSAKDKCILNVSHHMYCMCNVIALCLNAPAVRLYLK